MLLGSLVFCLSVPPSADTPGGQYFGQCGAGWKLQIIPPRFAPCWNPTCHCGYSSAGRASDWLCRIQMVPDSIPGGLVPPKLCVRLQLAVESEQALLLQKGSLSGSPTCSLGILPVSYSVQCSRELSMPPLHFHHSKRSVLSSLLVFPTL